MPEQLPTYGGQAVIEGVMMRGAKSVAIAMRSPDENIVLHTEPLGGIYTSKLTRYPFLRGLIVLWDAIGLGMRALTISANVQTGEDEQLEGPALYVTMAISLLFGVGLFFLLPAGATHALETYLLPLVTPEVSLAPWLSNLTEGLVRLSILILYIVLVGRVDDIRRVFGYHGAEHKTINAFEAGDALEPEIVAGHSLEHPRCGTAFLLSLVLISVLVFTLLGPMPLWLRLVSRVLLIPVMAAIAYEYIRWTATHLDSSFVRLIIRPNLALQRLTTREPTLAMIEVAIASFTAMREQEQAPSD
jgi:uncharacterized protein YqhQ